MINERMSNLLKKFDWNCIFWYVFWLFKKTSNLLIPSFFMSNLLRLLTKNEWPWANRSGRSPKISEWVNRLFFWANCSFAHFFAKTRVIHSENQYANSQQFRKKWIRICKKWMRICKKTGLGIGSFDFRANRSFFVKKWVNERFTHLLIFGERNEQFAHIAHFLWANWAKLIVAHFWWAKWAIHSHRSFPLSDLLFLVDSVLAFKLL